MGKTFKDDLVSKFGGPAKGPDDVDANFPVDEHSILESLEIDKVLAKTSVGVAEKPSNIQNIRDQYGVVVNADGIAIDTIYHANQSKYVLKPDDLPTEDDMVDDNTYIVHVDLGGFTGLNND